MTFIIDIFQFHCKSDHKISTVNLKSNGTCANLTVLFLIYKVVSTLFK